MNDAKTMKTGDGAALRKAHGSNPFSSLRGSGSKLSARRVLISGIGLALLGLATPTFAGRMLEEAIPTTAPAATEPPKAQAIEPPMDEEIDERDEQSSMLAEPADDTEREESVEYAPPLPLPLWKWSQTYRLTLSHNDNVTISGDHKQGDFILSPGAVIGLTWGDYIERRESFLNIKYAPSGVFYADHSNFNGYEQDGGVTGQWRIARLTLGLETRMQVLTGGDTDIGQRADRDVYHVRVSANYDLSDRTSIESNLTDDSTHYPSHLDSTQWSNHDWIDYRLFAKTKIGFGVTLGIAEAQGGPRQTFEQIQVRAVSVATGKVAFHATGGMELRQLGDNGGSETSPVFTVDATYHAFARTDLGLTASRGIYTSALLHAENYTGTDIAVRLRQRLSPRCYISLDGGYEVAAYSSVGGVANPSRQDHHYFFRPVLSCTVNKHCTVNLFYEYRRNLSTASGFSFDNNITSLEATFAY